MLRAIVRGFFIWFGSILLAITVCNLLGLQILVPFIGNLYNRHPHTFNALSCLLCWGILMVILFRYEFQSAKRDTAEWNFNPKRLWISRVVIALCYGVFLLPVFVTTTSNQGLFESYMQPFLWPSLFIDRLSISAGIGIFVSFILSIAFAYLGNYAYRKSFRRRFGREFHPDTTFDQ